MKVLVTPRSFGKTDGKVFEMLKDAGLEIVRNETGAILSEEAIIGLLRDCDGVILGVDPMNRRVIESAPKLKAIAKYGVGLDNIDLDACRARGIEVTRTVGANANAVADYAFSLLLAVARRVLTIDKACRHDDWGKLTTLDVYGKTLGLLGLGAVAKCVAQRAKGFGMTVMAYDIFWDDAYTEEQGIKRATLEEICRECDFISLHIPLSEDTRNMIGEREIGWMKQTAVLINTARGGIVNEEALLGALTAGRIYGAGIDAFEQEPPADKRWYALENVVLGSHCGASTIGATESMGRMATENIIGSLRGGSM